MLNLKNKLDIGEKCESLKSEDISKEVIQDWLIENISKLTNRNKCDINIFTPVSNYGLDSIHAVGLSGDIEQKFNIQVEPTLAWDYPTILKMSDYLYIQISDKNKYAMMNHQVVS